MGEGPKLTKEDEKALLEAKERAEIASRAKSEFLAAVSHELRIPLTGIIGMAQLLSIDCLLPGQREQVEDILKASDHLLSLVNDLLDLTKLETGKMELHLTNANLKDLLEEIASILGFEAKAKGLELRLDCDVDLPKTVITDARALRQILLNLIGNAIKFTEKGFILIKAKPVSLKANKVVIEFQVQDTGIGIPHDKQAIIFDRFSQADSSYTRRYGGTGLGLTLTKHLAELMGGSVKVESHLGQGSTFIVVIPFEIQNKEITIQKDTRGFLAETWEKPVGEYNTLGSASPPPIVLLVEDDQIVQKVHKMMLEKLGCTVEVAKNGKEAVAMTSKNYNIIFMDVGLPEMSGLEATKKIREQEGSKKHTPIVAMTAYVHEEDKNNCLAAGMDDVATKPISPDALKALLDQWSMKSLAG